jgi:hypothetical protein
MVAVAELPGRKYPTKIFLFSLRGVLTVTHPDDFMQERRRAKASARAGLGAACCALQKQSATADKVVQEKKRKRGATKTDG